MKTTKTKNIREMSIQFKITIKTGTNSMSTQNLKNLIMKKLMKMMFKKKKMIKKLWKEVKY